MSTCHSPASDLITPKPAFCQVEALNLVPLHRLPNCEHIVSRILMKSAGLRRLRVQRDGGNGASSDATLLCWMMHVGRQLEELYLADEEVDALRCTSQLLDISQNCRQLKRLTFSGDFLLTKDPTIGKMTSLK
eukprot:TRINITY_DN2072_c0_g2_i1.p1 TRINITY_DN2072_c0_g2~~TRINITY_DN2072_c0_g2_i1.p1  ORF type:complete len:133 (+),score=28.08 TRINITY_DN2072_c0_g2_i1:488-886(+)